MSGGDTGPKTGEAGSTAPGTPEPDTPEGDGPQRDGPEPGVAVPRRRSQALVVVAMVVVVFGTLTFVGGYALARGGPGTAAATPTDDSAAAGFARDMQSHHAQAVEMSMIVRDRTDDARVRTLAYDIALTQQQQIGQMYGWLTQWRLSQISIRPPLAWMGGAGGGMGGTGGHATSHGRSGHEMPGMATSDQMRRLAKVKDRDAEVLFLQLMVTHHQAGVQMAQGALTRTDNPQVKELATKMVTGQRSEIGLMRQMLRERA